MSIGEVYLSQTFKVTAPKGTVPAKTVAETKNVNKTSVKDGFEVSDFAKDLNTARKAIKETDDVRQGLVDDIKARFKAGQYEVNTSAIADKILG